MIICCVRPNLVPCFNLVPCSLEPPAHAFRALQSCRHAGDGLLCCLVTSSGTSSAANGRTGKEYQVKARYQDRANALLYPQETPPHTRTARAQPPAGHRRRAAAPTTTDTGNTVPQRANPPTFYKDTDENDHK